MPDIVSARPVSGEAIATAWGDEVHDAIEGVQAGNATVVPVSSTAASVAIVFPRPYATPPIVVASMSGPAALLSDRYYALVANVTALGCTLYAKHADNTSAAIGALPISWVAIGKPA